ncbi:tetratricopeptide repeat protein [Aquimarina sp. TRL1]|uniref:ATP-binding protein n=1 Tax=Aquimarina sp. (strain TRL1) TaxID=2736252 RepID=UPI00158AD059|nr:tetratricopeptide repeat-containing sensor histidine kinase [Aquimarina sp. TRL1]QKX04038.1 tetratricopeptide repeat protein [Aquimarina sp. TRL1]
MSCQIKIFLPILLISMLIGCTAKQSSQKTVTEEIEFYIDKAKNKKLPVTDRKQYLEEAYKIYDQLEDSFYKREKIDQIAMIYSGFEEYDIRRDLYRINLKLSTKIKDSFGIAKANMGLGIHYQTTELDSAYYYFSRALKVFDQLDGHEYIHGKTLIAMARVLQRTNDNIRAEALTVQAIKKFKKSERYTYMFLAYTNLGVISRYFKRYRQAIEYHKKAIENAIGAKMEVYKIVASYNNIGIVYRDQKKYEKAIAYFDKALTYKKYLKEKPKKYARLISNKAEVSFLSGKKENVLDLFYKALYIRDSLCDKPGLVSNYLDLSKYYKVINKDSIAMRFAIHAKDIALEIKNHEELLMAYKILSEVSPVKQRVGYAHAYIRLSDSLQHVERMYRNKFARIRYETAEKEQQINLVRNQNTIYLLVLLVALMGIGFSIFFFRQRTRNLAQQSKIAQFEARYETETRISKRLHDELGNDIFQLMLQYQKNPHDPQIKEKLNTSYHRARDISRENNEFDTGSSYGQELNNMLQNYAQNGQQLLVRGLDTMEWDPQAKTTKITVYRVLQELMTNMQKHSQASLVALLFKEEDKKLIIKYSDNGVGMDLRTTISKNGLQNTEKRIQAIGGSLIFDSEKDKGVKAEIQIPN